jgi:hypothetical protein
MFSVKSTLATRQLPPGFDVSTGIGKLCEPRPVSITRLRSLPPQTVVLDSGPLGPSTVSSSAQLAMNSDGYWSFRGNIHESGFIGHDYAFAMTLDFLDASGKAVSFLQEGTVHGTTDPFGSRDDDWQQNGHSSLIADNWVIIKTKGIRSNLHVSTNPIQAVEAVFAPIVLALSAAGYTLFSPDAKTSCEWDPVTDSQGGAGVALKCHNEGN